MDVETAAVGQVAKRCHSWAKVVQCQQGQVS